MENIPQILQEKIDFLHCVNRIERLSKGYSPDEKYVVYSDDKKFLLRIGNLEGYERKKTEFQVLQRMQEYHVRSPKPIEIGILDELNSCYTIYSFIEGVDVKETLTVLTDQEQYKIGIEAGGQLSKMHLLEAPVHIKSWYEQAMQKHYRYLDTYKESGIKIENDQKVINFIEKNKYVLKGRPSRFQHDDFHLQNIIVDNNRYAGVVDFNNFDWGDPIHDFVKVALFQRNESIPFSIGQIKGYFNHNVPEDFWMLYSIYAGMVIFSSVVWSLRFAPHQLDEMIERLHKILEDHKSFEVVKPLWYEPK
ncbi:aminoglycoside phosphotransferase family protein [Bacillus sp. 123MFChir2]|uniref:aminoglycoside phosphotransferase family protein n=1 Tax=Bacillus sp. 123MFChir2 TaxID=1169144 RepID=UPI00035C3A50|nr:aminoglycoside phosphotransferase family protein [Bacillus sp. 123MFChir2]